MSRPAQPDPEPWLRERVVKLGGQRVVKLGPGATAAEVAEAEALARVIEHSGRQVRQSAGVPPNAIMVPEEAEPIGFIQPDGTWRYPVSHWPGGLRQAKAAAEAAGYAERGRPYSLPSVTPSPPRLPLEPARPPPLPRTKPLTGRQPREIRGPRPAPGAVTPAIQAMLDRCPICGMDDLASGEILSEWEGWPVHADCAEWIRGSDEEPQRREAAPQQPAPRIVSRRWLAAEILACALFVTAGAVVITATSTATLLWAAGAAFLAALAAACMLAEHSDRHRAVSAGADRRLILRWPGGGQDVSAVEQVTLRVEDADGETRELTVDRPYRITIELVASLDLSAPVT